MEDFYMGSHDENYNDTNFTTDSQNYANLTNGYHNNVSFTDEDLDSIGNYLSYNILAVLVFVTMTLTQYVITCVFISLGLPLSLAAIFSLRAQVSNDHVAPIYVINLLISDLLQFCYMIIEVATPGNLTIFFTTIYIYLYSLMASVGFMVCVSLERYLAIVHPLWYRCRRSIKSTVVVCVVVWLLPLVHILTLCLQLNYKVPHTIFGIFIFLPFPLLLFSLVATVKALSASTSVSSEEKRRIVGVLVLVLLIYTLMFLPTVLWFLANVFTFELIVVSSVFLKLSPLADLVLYVFTRKGAVDKLLSAVCC